MYVLLSLLCLLSGLGINASEKSADPEQIMVTLKNEKLKQELSFGTTRATLNCFPAFKSMFEDLQSGEPIATIPIHSTKYSALYCLRDQFDIVTHNSTKHSAFADGNYHDMHEYMRMADYAGIKDEKMLSLFIQRGPDELVRILKPHILGEHTDEALKDCSPTIFPLALKESNNADIKKFGRHYLYEKMYENKEFEELEKVVLDGMDENLKPKILKNDEHRYIKDLDALKRWEESCERKAFCALVGDEPSLHKAYDYEKGNVFYSQWDEPESSRNPFVYNYFSHKGVAAKSLEYLHLPLLRLIMMYDSACYNDKNKWNEKGFRTTFDFSDRKTPLERVDWKTVAKYPAKLKISWSFHLNDTVKSIPWDIVQTIPPLKGHRKDFRTIRLISQNELLPFSMKEMKLVTLSSFTQKLRNALPYIAGIAAFCGVLYFPFWWHNRCLLDIKNTTDRLLSAASEETVSLVREVVKPGQAILPGFQAMLSSWVELPVCAKPFEHNDQLCSNQSIITAGKLIEKINNSVASIVFKGKASFFLVCISYLVICASACVAGMWIVSQKFEHEHEVLFHGNSMRRYALYKGDYFNDQKHGFTITVEKPKEDAV